MSADSIKTINILGVTGSVGQSTVDVILSAPHLFKVNVITAHHDSDGLNAARERLGAKHAVLTSRDDHLLALLSKPVDLTVCAVSGFAGLEPLLVAIEHSRAVAVANKEPLVAAGALVLEACKAHGTTLLPLDSEHNAIFQVFDFERPQGIDKIILTASGGPFREWSAADIAKATPEQAIAHPNWDMGAKISVDSASMMNKALEIIEAAHLFDLPPEQIDVLIHPQSVVHSMVEYKDGSVLAQMGASDMRTPIAYALSYPDRMDTPGDRLDLKSLSALQFEAVDLKRFPAVQIAFDCLRSGQGACIAMNAANEVAVDAFLNGGIGFGDIIGCIHYALEHSVPRLNVHDFDGLQDIVDYDQAIRQDTAGYIKSRLAA